MQRIWWNSVTGDVLRYDLQKASDPRWFLIGQVASVIPGDNWDPERNQFFFDDTLGDPDDLYRVTAISTNGSVIGESDIFQSHALTTTQTLTKVRVDHDYGQSDALRYLSPGSIPIAQADILIFSEPDWNQGRRTIPIAKTQTSNDGRWAAPVYLPTGLNYVVYFFKESAYGPDTTTITV